MSIFDQQNKPDTDHLIMRDAQDVKSGYALFLLRAPESQGHISGWIGKSLAEMARAFLNSPEFVYAIAPKLGAAPGTQPTFGIVPGDVHIHFRHAMVRYCGLAPSVVLTGMSGWRWALFWLFTLPQIRAIASEINLDDGTFLQALSAQVTWDVYGSLEDEARSAGPVNVATDTVGAIASIDAFGVLGHITLAKADFERMNGVDIRATLYEQPLWPIFCEREIVTHSAGHSDGTQTTSDTARFVLLFDHVATDAALRLGVESQLRTGRRGQGRVAQPIFSIQSIRQNSETNQGLSGTITCPMQAQDLAFWAHLLDIDVTEEASSNRDLLAVSRAHWAASTALPKLIAFYLPQFYPFRENDNAWGEGFSEWTNVVSAAKAYPSHASPLIPADLGYYDLRSREVRARQAELALQSGVHGFCYYFYWFSGRQVMGEVLQRMLRDGQPSLPFCLCWANENWSRRWDGSDDDVIVSQTHDAIQDAAIVDDLARFFDDPRYIRIDGAPLFLIYHLSSMAEPAQFILNLRNRAKALGYPELVVAGVLSHGEPDPVDFGCDFGVQFPPHEMGKRKIDPKSLGASPSFSGEIYDYCAAGEAALAQTRGLRVFPGVMPRWDNSARRGQDAHMFHGSTPQAFQAWLGAAIARTLKENPEAPFVFINSWNEWAEGAMLEPDRHHGRAYLDAVRGAVSSPSLSQSFQQGENALTGLSQALIHENNFLASWLSSYIPLVKSGALRDGLPPVCADLPLKAGAKCELETVDGVAQSEVPAMAVGTSCVLGGWSLGDPTTPSLYRYLLVERLDGLGSWFLPCPVRKAIDLSNYNVVQAEGEQAGFQIGLPTKGLTAGTYALSILDVTKNAGHKSLLLARVTLV